MNIIVTFLLAHPYVDLVVAFLLLSVANALLPYESMRNGAWWKRAIGSLLDRIAGLARRDSPQTLTWPLIGRSLVPWASLPPAERPTPPDSMRPPVPPLPLLLMVVALGLVGCSDPNVMRSLKGFARILATCAVEHRAEIMDAGSGGDPTADAGASSGGNTP